MTHFLLLIVATLATLKIPRRKHRKKLKLKLKSKLHKENAGAGDESWWCKPAKLQVLQEGRNGNKRGVALNSLIVLLIKTNVNVCTSKLQKR